MVSFLSNYEEFLGYSYEEILKDVLIDNWHQEHSMCESSFDNNVELFMLNLLQ